MTPPCTIINEAIIKPAGQIKTNDRGGISHFFPNWPQPQAGLCLDSLRCNTDADACFLLTDKYCMRCYLLGLGSNLEPHKHLPGAITELAHLGRISAQSPVVTTAPVGDTFHYEFCNQLLVLESDLLPGPLKQRLQHIEVKLGREPKNPGRKTKDRTIDIDILATADTADACRQATLEEPYYLRVQQQWQAV